jgi:transcriptional regulator with XRE-family HTH domain
MNPKRDWLISIRKSEGLTQQQISSKTGISQNFYSDIELGKRRPSYESAKRLGMCLGIPWRSFFEM